MVFLQEISKWWFAARAQKERDRLVFAPFNMLSKARSSNSCRCAEHSQKLGGSANVQS